MSSQKHPKPPSKIGAGKFEIVKRLGAGCFGVVYAGRRIEDGKEVAVKCEIRQVRSVPQLHHEVAVIAALRSGPTMPPQGVVECYYFGVEGNFNCLVMERLSRSLEDQVQACKGKFSVKTTVLIAEQVLQRIEFLHSMGFVHRDIKPENFCFGVKDKVHHVYIIDFGLSKTYWDKQRSVHAPMRQRLSLTGTARYASINCHKGVEQSRRDDIEAIGHMLMYFLLGKLPWSGLDAKTMEEKYRKIMEKKEQTQLCDLCQNFPKQFHEYLDYSRNLGYKEKPDYDMLFELIHSCREPDWKDYSFQWFEDIPPPGKLTPLQPRVCCPQPDGKVARQGNRGCFCLGGPDEKQITYP